MRTRIARSSRHLIIAALAGGIAAGAWPQVEAQIEDPPDPGEAPSRDDIQRESSYDPGPELQRTPGGSLIVNAFIMQGPVRVEIRDRESDEILLEKEERSLFPFEVGSTDLGVEPERVLVRIFIRGNLSHELELER